MDRGRGERKEEIAGADPVRVFDAVNFVWIQAVPIDLTERERR